LPQAAQAAIGRIIVSHGEDVAPHLVRRVLQLLDGDRPERPVLAACRRLVNVRPAAAPDWLIARCREALATPARDAAR